MNGEYSIPSHVSSDARDLITRLLEVDPQRRYTCQMVRQHPWYIQCTVATDPSTSSYNVSTTHDKSAPLQESVLRHMEELGYDCELVIESVQKRRYNHYAATYHLLCLQSKRTSHDSYPPSGIGTAHHSSISLHESSAESVAVQQAAAVKPINIQVLQLESDRNSAAINDHAASDVSGGASVTYMSEQLPSHDTVTTDASSEGRSSYIQLQQDQHKPATTAAIHTSRPQSSGIRLQPPSAVHPVPLVGSQPLHAPAPPLHPQPPTTYHSQVSPRPPTGSYPIRPISGNMTARAASAYVSGRVQSQYGQRPVTVTPHSITNPANMAAQLQMAFVISRPPTQQTYRIPIQQPIHTSTHKSPYAPHPPTPITPIIGTTSRPNTARKPPVPKFKRKGKPNGRSNTVENIYVRNDNNVQLNQWMADVPLSAMAASAGSATTSRGAAAQQRMNKARVSSATYRPPTSYQLHTRQPLTPNHDPHHWLAMPISSAS